MTVTHPRCSACFTVFNGRLAEPVVEAIAFSPCSERSAMLPADARGSLGEGAEERACWRTCFCQAQLPFAVTVYPVLIIRCSSSTIQCRTE